MNNHLREVCVSIKFKKNPWVTIWANPRATLSAIIQRKPNYCFYLLAEINGLVLLLPLLKSILLNRQYLGFIGLLLLAFLVGVICISIMSALYFWIGKLMKGKGSFRSVRTVVAWSNAPNLIALIVWMIFIFTLQPYSETSYLSASTNSSDKIMVCAVAQVAASIWSIVILIVGISLVQRFSIGKSAVNFVLATLFPFLCILVVWVAVLIILMILWMIRGMVV